MLDNQGGYNVAYVLSIFMLKGLKSYTNTLPLALKAALPPPPEFSEFIAASICA
jgi:hypothetical protein